MIPYKEQETIPPDISKAIDMALAYNPSLAMRDISTIRMWVNEGCDMDLDIIPTFEAIMKRKQGISTFSYFTNAILDSKTKRLIKAKVQSEQSAHPDSYYAEKISWKRDRGLTVSTADLAFLEKHEREIKNPA